MSPAVTSTHTSRQGSNLVLKNDGCNFRDNSVGDVTTSKRYLTHTHDAKAHRMMMCIR